MKPYRYVTPQIAAPEFSVSGVNRVGDEEQLTGQLQGLPASDLEERMAKSFDGLKTSYTFRARISSELLGSRRLTKQFRNLPGEVEIDLLLESNPVTPVLIDGQISHFMSYWKQEEDRVKADIVDEFGEALGWRKVVRVPFVDIPTPEASDRVAKEILDGTYTPSYMG